MPSLRPLLVVLAGCCLLAPVQARSGEMQFRQLTVRWPAGYTVLRAADPTLLRGPRAQEVAVSVHEARVEAAPAAAAKAEQRRFTDRSAHLVRSVAASHGRVLRLTRSVLPDGSTLVAAASQSRRGAKPYLLQFTVLASTGQLAYFTVQGQGHGSAEYRRLLPAFQSVRWSSPAEVGRAIAVASN